MKKRLLVVDDDRPVCDALRKLLEAEGYEVFTAYDATDAIECFQGNAIDLVILDVNLGAENGWVVFQAMVEINPFVPTVVITAEFGQRERAIAVGVEVLIEKPIDVPSFLELIEELLAENSTGRRPRVCGEESYCRYVAKDYATFLKMLEERSSAPLDLASESTFARSRAHFRPGFPSRHLSVVGDPTTSCMGGDRE